MRASVSAATVSFMEKREIRRKGDDCVARKIKCQVNAFRAGESFLAQGEDFFCLSSICLRLRCLRRSPRKSAAQEIKA